MRRLNSRLIGRLISRLFSRLFTSRLSFSRLFFACSLCRVSSGRRRERLLRGRLDQRIRIQPRRCQRPLVNDPLHRRVHLELDGLLVRLEHPGTPCWEEDLLELGKDELDGHLIPVARTQNLVHRIRDRLSRHAARQRQLVCHANLAWGRIRNAWGTSVCFYRIKTKLHARATIPKLTMYDRHPPLR